VRDVATAVGEGIDNGGVMRMAADAM
jgi:hypothetical protein